MKAEWFDPHKSFLSLKIVWVMVSILLAMSISSASVILVHSDLESDFSYSGFNYFISVFKFPLAIAALIIPIVALLAANHRSEQTKEQIRVTNSQNVFSNYYKHIEEFTKYLEVRVEKSVDLRFAHNNLYPNASHGDYNISSQVIALLSELDNVISEVLEHYPTDINMPIDADLMKKYYAIINEMYGFIYRHRDDYRQHITYTMPKDHGDSYLFRSKSLIQHSLAAVKILEEACKFSIEYISPVKCLNFTADELKNVYVYKKPENQKTLTFQEQKKDQTFEEANDILIEILKSNVVSA
ncbi:hypothetical protein ACP43V_02790 [Vibrio genomosp. F10 str. 9ZC157]|uniref:hypothetical protein n=1 Tax=Vibrio genomosp. F10 TaxID=723171 RepID=UPI0003005D08|nr:hypothetical protein [Vibrio genomosp. F10]OEE97846.1 hypothetical protein A1QM_13620 [Vibrio genomosp. F10 str. 9ZC157]